MQSFVDQETRSVGRLHTRDITLADIASLRSAGIAEISLDLIAGLPHQTPESWDYSLAETIATGVPHVSVYMLEVDEDSRLGRELIAGGTRYHAHHVPDDDLVADFYLKACETLNAAGVHQYEISNFARANCENNEMCHPKRSTNGVEPKDVLPNPANRSQSALKGHGFSRVENAPRNPAASAAEVLPAHASRHNLKYWLRRPYLGFGVDAHSMLCTPHPNRPHAAVRFATTDNLDALLADAPLIRTEVDENNALEEAFFLGLRLNRGIDLDAIANDFGPDALTRYREQIAELTASGLLLNQNNRLRLTDRGRLLSNEVFSPFLAD
jgi:oxygen-independent coproporphyrinogen-3 oxidase